MQVKFCHPSPSQDNLLFFIEVTAVDSVQQVLCRAQEELAVLSVTFLVNFVYNGLVITESENTIANIFFGDESVVWIVRYDVAQVGEPGASVIFPRNAMADLFPFLSCEEPSTKQQMNVSDDSLLNLMESFVGSLNEDSAWWLWQPSLLDRQKLALAVSRLSSNNEIPVSWFGDYGCALVPSLSETCVDEVHLRLIALDSWRFSVHTSSLGAHTHVSIPEDYTKLFLGYVRSADFHNFIDRIHALLRKAQKFKGDQRSSAGGHHQGHQKTPAMIAAIVKDALNHCEDAEALPQGAFTDVGLHTGGQKRRTAWPLLCAVFRTFLEDEHRGHLYGIFSAQLLLACTEEALSLQCFDDRAVAQMLHASVSEGCKLGNRGVDMGGFTARCAIVRHKLIHGRHQDSVARANYFKLPSQLEDTEVATRRIEVTLPKEINPTCQEDTFSESRLRARLNLGIHLVPPPEKLTWLSLQGWLQLPFADNQLPSIDTNVLVLSTVESFVFTLAEGLNIDAIASQKVHTKVPLTVLEDVLDKYRRMLSYLRVERRGIHAPFLSSELNSRELLVGWIIFSVVHANCLIGDPLLREYGVGLNWRCLSHLTLSDKVAIDAALQTATYLRKFPYTHKPVFSLNANDATFELARRHALTSSALQICWQNEKKQMNVKKAAHWKAVQEKKNVLRRLDDELQCLENELIELEEELRALDCRRGPTYFRHEKLRQGTTKESDRKYRYALSYRDSLLTQIAEKKARIKAEEVPPKPLIQPLPKEEDLALPIVFFLQLPEMYQVLSRLSFTAQQMLLPGSGDDLTLLHSAELQHLHGVSQLDIEDMIKSENPKTLWQHHYDKYSSAKSCKRGPGKVILGSRYAEPQNMTWFPKNVRKYLSDSDGVWYPDYLRPALYWKGGGCKLDMRRQDGYFNPFAHIPNIVTARKFTANIGDSSMQWAIEQHGNAETSPLRTNWPIASLQSKPTWLPEKSQYLTFGSLRSVPNQQFRKICSVLRERSLPLDNQEVHVLIKQALYHLGEFSDDNLPIRLLWKTDTLNLCDGWATLRTELAGHLHCMVRDHPAIWLLGELSCFASQWDTETRDVCRRLAHIARKWGDDAVIELRNAEANGDRRHIVASLRLRCCLFYMYGVVCHSYGEITSDDVTELVQLIALAEHYRLFEDNNTTEYGDEFRQLTLVVCGIVARRLPCLMARHVDSDLTKAVQLIKEDIPCELSWENVRDENGNQTQCYESECHKDLFSFSLQTGVFLVNGFPPRRLPISMVAMPLYKRTFGDRNFDVVVDKNGVLSTVRPIFNRIYTFFMDGRTKQLIVKEYNKEQRDVVFQLLDVANECWAADLPERLQHMHSHWLCRAKGILLFRDPTFDRNRISFMLIGNKNEDSSPCSTWSCYKIPEHMKNKDWLRELLPLCEQQYFDELILLSQPKLSSVWKVFNKFEVDGEYIHVLRTAESGTLLFELPRYGLSFELAGLCGTLRSLNYSGYSLSGEQLLVDVLDGFQQYMVLRSDSCADVVKVLIPSGQITKRKEEFKAGNAAVTVEGPTEFDADRALCVYHVHHRFKRLEVAEAGPLAVEQRLQLAAIYAATDSGLVNKALSLTHGEIAMELLRYSRVNKPFSDNELRHLFTILQFGQQCTPALALLSYDLMKQSCQVNFLYGEKEIINPMLYPTDVATDYCNRKARGHLNSRAQLTVDEETRILAPCHQDQPPRRSSLKLPAISTSNHCESVRKDIEAAILQGDFLKPLEKSTLSLVDDGKLPLDLGALRDTELGRSVAAELQASWDAHCSIQQQCLGELSCKELVLLCSASLKMIRTSRERLELELLHHVSNVPVHACRSEPNFLMNRSANLIPTVSNRDFLKAAWDPDSLLQFNPFLSRTSLDQLRYSILVWLQACVLEDKLQRMIKMATNSEEQLLIRELQEVRRNWDVATYPEWLVFEVEQRLQIRQVQYVVAKFLMHTPGTVTQLNMGEGKTRIIIPILLLHLTKLKPDAFLRLHFLAPLLAEAFDYLHFTLTASVLNRPIMLLPFHRKIVPSVTEVRKILQCLYTCQRAKGVVCLAREHWMSLHLKWHELYLKEEEEAVESEAVDDNIEIQKQLALVAQLPYVDIIDESDEVLRHKYQLIYAVGSSDGLPNGPERWIAAEAILYQLHHNEEVSALLALPGVAVRTSPDSKEISDWRLLQGQDLLCIEPELMVALAKGVLKNPPHHMRALKNHAVIQRDIMITFVTEPSVDIHWLGALGLLKDVDPLQVAMLLALRGFLACGVLVHCMTLRHRVDYGVDDRRGIGNRTAVPYCASDTPADRAEFAQPDKLILLTLLAYYHRGLSMENVKEATKSLLSLGPIAQAAEFKLWLASVGNVKSNMLTLVDDVAKLDLSSSAQQEIMHTIFSHNKATVNFWLNSCVFPRETMQFPQRLVANAFHLTQNRLHLESKVHQQCSSIMGFSGTKDSHLLLPHHVQQDMPKEVSMLATDGKMIARLLLGSSGGHRPTASTVTEEDTRDESVNSVQVITSSTIPIKKAEMAKTPRLSQMTLEMAVSGDYDALIDAGATMAGLSNHDVAIMVLRRIVDTQNAKLQFKGVVYFDQDLDSWYVLSRDSREWPLGSSPIRESEAFVFFDESRCRGADMKLRSDAKALLTIGPDMGKDKLMQAVGRMRGLIAGGQQRVTFAIPEELVTKILDASGETTGTVSATANDQASQLGFLSQLQTITVHRLLEWVLLNSVHAVARGLPQWAAQGSHFFTTSDPVTRRVDETLTLKDLYSEALHEESVSAIAVKNQERSVSRMRTILQAHHRDDIDLDEQGIAAQRAILQRVEQYGRDVHFTISNFDEECERELECEREVECEVEKQLPEKVPCIPELWDFSAVLTALRPRDLAGAQVMALSEELVRCMDNADAAFSMGDINWASCGIFVTRNFMRTVKGMNLSQYLRLVDAVLCFHRCDETGSKVVHSCLLLSELEADYVLEILWEQSLQSALTEQVASSEPISSNACKVSMCSLPFLLAAGASASAVAVSDKTLEIPVPALLVPATTHHPPATSGAMPAASAVKPSALQSSETIRIRAMMLVGLTLFSGGTMFGGDQSSTTSANSLGEPPHLHRNVKLLHQLLPTRRAKLAALQLPEVRGRRHMLSRSDLEDVCVGASDLDAAK